MLVLIVGDIHANFGALEAVFDAAGTVDAVWCLGDTVGYGPQPNECVRFIRDRSAVTLVGNHDLGCLGTISLANFNREARIANEWNGEQLTADNREFLLGLTPMARVDDTVTLAHGSPRDPVWEYLLDAYSAATSLNHFDTQVCFVGHTHQPVIYTAVAAHDVGCTITIPNDEMVLKLHPNKRYIINPGGVGQPRDGDARAAFAIYDSDKHTVAFRRTAYNIRRTQTLMLDHGLPEILAARLSFGL